MPLSSVNNLTVKDCVIAKMAAELKDGAPRFSPKSITNYVQIVKMVVASAVDEKGEEIYPVKWKNDFMDLPVIEGQNKPSFTAEEITTIFGCSARKPFQPYHQTVTSLISVLRHWGGDWRAHFGR